MKLPTPLPPRLLRPILLSALASPCPNPGLPAPKPPLPADCRLRPVLHLAPGEQRLLRLPARSRFSLGNDAVARILPRPGGQDGSLLLKAIAPGSGSLWTGSSPLDCDIQPLLIHAIDPKAAPVIPLELGRLLSRLEEIEVYTSGAGALLRGEIQNLPEAEAIERVRTLFPEKVTDDTTLSPRLLEEASDRLGRIAPLSRLEVIPQGGRISIRGSLDDPTTEGSLRRSFRDVFPLFDWRVDALPDSSPTLSFKVYLLEVRRNRFGTLGIEWPSDWRGGLRAAPLRFENPGEFELRLKTLSGDGSARILSEPEISVRAPGQAELFSGGELPVRTGRRRESQVDWRPFGLSLRLKVEKATERRVRLDIETEMSALDAATQDQAIPRMQTNRLRTQVDGSFGVPLLLTGLVQQGWHESAQGLPFLRSLPVIGALFESEDYLHHQSELAAVLLPRAVPPEPPIERFMPGLLPRGPRPAPRNFLSPEEERDLRSSPDFPWNAFGEGGA